MLMSFEAIGRILSAVEKAGGGIPERLVFPEPIGSTNVREKAASVRKARIELARDISWADTRRALAGLKTGPTVATRLRELAKLDRCAREILEKVGSPDGLLHSDVNRRLGGASGPTISEIADGLTALRGAIGQTKLDLTAVERSGGLNPFLPPGTPGGEYLGRLGATFEKVFGCDLPKFAYGTEREVIGGPFVVFVQAVAEERRRVGGRQGLRPIAERLERCRQRDRGRVCRSRRHCRGNGCTRSLEADGRSCRGHGRGRHRCWSHGSATGRGRGSSHQPGSRCYAFPCRSRAPGRANH